MSAAATAPFHFVAHWQTHVAENDEAILKFWRRENAIGDDGQAQQRLREVVLDARTPQGEVAGVCTAAPVTLPRLGQPMYYYRCFIGSDWRKTRLVSTLLIRAFEALEDYARNNGYPCIGVVLELENARFGETLRRPVWPSTGFIYVGKSARGLDLRLRYFRGARLKKHAAP
jgi:hypothetical protein